MYAVQVVHIRGRGYLNRSYYPAGVYFFTHALTTYRCLHDVYSTTFKRKPSEGVGHVLTNHASLSYRFIAYSGSIRKEIRSGCPQRPQTMCTGFPGHQTGDSVHRDTCLPHRSPPLGSALHTASSILQTPETSCNSWTEVKVINKSRGALKHSNAW